MKLFLSVLLHIAGIRVPFDGQRAGADSFSPPRLFLPPVPPEPDRQKPFSRRHTIFSIRYQPKKSKHSFLRAGSFPAAAHPGKAPRSRRFSPASGRPAVCRRLLLNMGVFHGKSGKNPAKMFFENGAKFYWTNGFSSGRF